jgi:HlyD family type I secretion membrane fusion protein
MNPADTPANTESQAQAATSHGSAAMLDIRRWTLIGIIIILSTLGVAVVWSSLAPIASAVIAQGVVKVDTSRKKIQHLEGGQIQEIMVRDGDRVKVGDVLIRLDPTRADASHGVLRTGLDAALAQQSRLMAERDGLGQVGYPATLQQRRNDPHVAELIKSQDSLFRARKASLDGQLSILDKQIVALNKRIEGIAAQQLAKEDQLRSLKLDVEGFASLAAQGMLEKTRVRTTEREIARLEGERSEHIADIAQTRTSISEKELEKFQTQKKFREEVMEELRRVQTEINDYTERIGAARHVLEQTEIRAPVDGTVVDSRIHTTRGVITPGEVLMEIVPSQDRLIVEAKVRPEDIDRVRLGLATGVKLSAFDQRSTPELNGKVSYVSADIIEDSKTGVAYFLIKVEVTEEELKRLKGQSLQPGMLAEVFVRTGERTFFAYLLDPLVSSFNKAWREK